MTTLVLLAVGATTGAAARYAVTLWAAQRFGTAFPYGTMVANVGGCLLLGAILAFARTRPTLIGPELQLFMVTGLCGCLTTFSTFSYETVVLFQAGRYLAGALNMLLSVTLGILAIILGAVLVQTFAV